MAKRNELVRSVLEQLGADLICEMDGPELRDIIFDRSGARLPVRGIVRQKIVAQAGLKLRTKRTGLSFNNPRSNKN